MYSSQLTMPPRYVTGIHFNEPVDLLGSYAVPAVGRVFLVRGNASTGAVLNYDDQYTAAMPSTRIVYPSVATALTYCAANRGDQIICLPGHTENIATANAWPLVAGVRIVGLGGIGDRPTFTWTTATSTVLMNKANVRLENLNLNFCPAAGGGVTVAAPITISAAGCAIVGGQICMSTDTTTLCTIGVTTTAGATDLLISVPRVYGATAGTPTTGFQFVGATRLNLLGTSISIATSAVGVGVIRFLTTASTDIQVYDCVFRNNLANSTAAVTGMAGVTGECDFTTMKVLSGGAAAWGTVAGMSFGPNVCACNTDGQRAVGFGTGSTLA